MVQRLLFDSIKDVLYKGKIIVLIGPRQVGKTSLLKKICASLEVPFLWMNADEPDLRMLLENPTSSELKNIVGANKLIVIDEAQQIKDIGATLKLFADALPEVQVVATGSSAFELRNKLNEPLTGRKLELHLFPFSSKELELHFGKLNERRSLEHRLIYGMYPEVITTPSGEEQVLRELTNSYLYKDLLMVDGIKKASMVDKLLQALALQIGNEVSYHELGQLLGGVDPSTVERYIDLLEKTYVIFRLHGFNRNLRNEIKKGKKIYFWDNGIRNSLIKNFNPLALRNDKGALWENFIVSERIKRNVYSGYWCNYYFWRTHDGAEIDFIEERGGILNAFEMKWDSSKKTIKIPRSFAEAYPEHTFEVIDRNSYEKFVG